MNATRSLDQRRQHNHPEAGLSIVSVIIGFVLLSGIIIGALSVYVNQSNAARNLEAQTAANLYANGVIERTRAMPWSDLGFTDTAVGVRASDDKGRPTVILPSLGSYQKVLSPLEHGIGLDGVKGSQFDVRTDVTWEEEPDRSVITGNLVSGYGVKRVTVTMTWGAAHSVVVSGLRTPTIGEAIPSDIQNDGGFDVGDNVAAPTLLADVPSMSLVGTVDRSWEWTVEGPVAGTASTVPSTLNFNNAEKYCGPNETGELYSGAVSCKYARVDAGGWFRLSAQTSMGLKSSPPVYLNAINNFKAPVLTNPASAHNYNDFSWTSPTEGLIGYFPVAPDVVPGGLIDLRRSTAQNGAYSVISGNLPGTTRTFRENNPPSGMNWYQACATLGTNTQCSNKVSRYTIYPAAQPVLTLTYAASNSVATATWPTITDAAGYTLRHRTLTNGTWSGWTSVNQTSAQRTWTRTMTNGTTMEVQVQAYNDKGLSAWSGAKSVQSLLLAPKVTFTGGDLTGAYFSWPVSTGATSYTFQYRINNGGWIAGWNLGNVQQAWIRSNVQGDLVGIRVAAVNSTGQSAWSAEANGYLTISGTGATGWTINDGRPYYRTQVHGATCQPGTVVQGQFRDRVTAWDWNPWGAWVTGSYNNISPQFTSTIDSYEYALGVGLRIRCYNPATGIASGYTEHGEYQRRFAIGAPWGLWASITSYRVAGWGAACDAGLTTMYDWWITGNINTGETNTTRTSYANTGKAWGAGTISLSVYCAASWGTGPRSSYVSGNFG